MAKRAERDNQFFMHMSHTLEYHKRMLSDAPRNRAFYNALKKKVLPGSTVLDIGAGTGLWSVVAARLGARHVVAVEKERLLIPIIQNFVKESRVQDRVEVVEGDSREIKLKTRFDIVVSEMIGNLGFDEDIVPIFIDARKRLLKPGGAMIPSTVSLFAAAAHYDLPYKVLPSGIPLRSKYLELINMNMSVRLQNNSGLKILSKPAELIRVDLTTVKSDPNLNGLVARWKLKDVAGVNAFAVWAESDLSEGVKIKTIKTAHWNPILHLIKPMKGKRGELELRLALSNEKSYWTATLSEGDRAESQTYSPVFTYTALKAAVEAASAPPKKAAKR